NSFALLFFFQAEDGIRDFHVTGFRRVLFRSRGRKATASGHCNALVQYGHVVSKIDYKRQNNGRTILGLGSVLTIVEHAEAANLRSEERRVGKASILMWNLYNDDSISRKTHVD